MNTMSIILVGINVKGQDDTVPSLDRETCRDDDIKIWTEEYGKGRGVVFVTPMMVTNDY
jgi:hypothetical protein